MTNMANIPPVPFPPTRLSPPTNMWMPQQVDSVSPDEPVLISANPVRHVSPGCQIVCEGEEVDISITSETVTFIQKGPRCGFAAIAMVGHLPHMKPVDIDSLYHKARARGITKQGELFSAYDVFSLLRDELGWTIDLHRIESIEVTRYELSTHLLSGGCLLLPYDKDKNYEPCENGGKSAHWALITGCRVRLKLKTLANTPLSTRLQNPSPDVPLTPEDVHLIASHTSQIEARAAHGKSHHLRWWDLDQLLRSNMNLAEPNEAICRSKYGCVLPNGGLHKVLSHCVLIIHSLQ